MSVRLKQIPWGISARCGAFAGFLVALSGCGYVGDTKPPTLDIPTRITDLRAAEFGANIAVEFTLPPLTTEGLTLKNARAIEIRIYGEGQEKRYPVLTKEPGSIAQDVPVQEWIGRSISVSARAIGPKGKASDWSNEARMTVGPPLTAPTSVAAKGSPAGVELSWAGAGPGYRIFRANGDGMPERLAESPNSPYTDTSAAFGTRYRYMVQSLDGEARMSELSMVAEITPKDEFPPAVPAGLSAVAGVDSTELSWERNTEDDFLNYNIYRSVGDTAFEKVATGVEAPVFSDRMIETGKRYRYSVTSVDVNGNESARSAVAEVVAQ
ncbi:MAG: hypothetical protein ABL967_15405 [Bryobacteraceae bacterium]